MIVYTFAFLIMILWAYGVNWRFNRAMKDLTRLEEDANMLCPCPQVP